MQLRRTARVDASVAMDMQKAEVDQFRVEEEARRRELEEKFVVLLFKITSVLNTI